MIELLAKEQDGPQIPVRIRHDHRKHRFVDFEPGDGSLDHIFGLVPPKRPLDQPFMNFHVQSLGSNSIQFTFGREGSEFFQLKLPRYLGVPPTTLPTPSTTSTTSTA